MKRFKISNRYYYVCEEGLIKPEEVPEYAGLIYVYSELKYVSGDILPGCMEEIKPAPLLHRERASTEIYTRVAKILSNRMVYGCSYMKYHYNKLRRTK